ncbi:ADP-ribosyltransferase [Crenobacter intestini]|uniref:ADP ribosyltransferase domain-containing protein n=1 Tax=Crenobacter intestini TaxID=2563443 RepID=A0A4T0V5X8_9NEIS|nr:ADP-ribosyltransferase [Crenobacter intestini]TIC87178.1 hypothetical protein E5K04_01815 [Crenobacter intestini]
MTRDEFFKDILPRNEALVDKIKRGDLACGCLRNLSDEEIRSIYCYTTEDRDFSYVAINNELQSSNGASMGSRLHFQIEKIDSGLEKLRPYTEDCYRGEDEDGRLDSLIKKGKQATEYDVVYIAVNFFMSTSMDKKSDFLEKKINYIIQNLVDEQSKARNISHASHFPDEKETLYKRNATFFVSDIEETADGKFEVYLVEVLE